MISFNELLEKHRQYRGISKKQLAQEADLSPGYVSLLINGGRGSPSLETIDALARVLQLDQADKEELIQAAGVDTSGTSSSGKPARLTLVQSRISEILQDGILDAKSAGIVAVHPDFPDNLFEEMIMNANECVRIHTTWIADPHRYRRAFLRASKRGITIQVLLLEPTSSQAKQRSIDLGLRSDQFVSEQIESNIYEFERLYNEGVKVEVKLYESLPSVDQATCDDRTFVGFFIHGERSDLAPQMEIQGANTRLGRFFNDEFEAAWKHAKLRVPVQSTEQSSR